MKLSDFGTAKVLQTATHTANVGTLLFAPPEFILSNRDLFAGDMWALGVTIYLMLVGQLAPLRGTSIQDHPAVQEVLDYRSSTSRHADFPAAALDQSDMTAAVSLIRDTMAHRPHERLTAMGATEHLWFSDPYSRQQPAVLSLQGSDMWTRSNIEHTTGRNHSPTSEQLPILLECAQGPAPTSIYDTRSSTHHPKKLYSTNSRDIAPREDRPLTLSSDSTLPVNLDHTPRSPHTIMPKSGISTGTDVAGFLDYFDYSTHDNANNKSLEIALSLMPRSITPPYSVLGISPDSTNVEIAMAYRRIFFQYHPGVIGLFIFLLDNH